MKEMIYKPERTLETLDTGTYKGYDYVINSYGTHPCAYVQIPEGIDKYNLDDIECHFGVTYSSKRLVTEEGTRSGWWIGWDYAHYTDYAGYLINLSLSIQRIGHFKKWTTVEIQREVYEVIEQLISLKER